MSKKMTDLSIRSGYNHDGNSTKDVECRAYHSMSISDMCGFVMNTPDCDMDDGFINYLSFVFCKMPPSFEVLGLIILCVWWLILFIALATTADKFFCPSLAVISKTLRMSENLAGVTFLAFGNGSPDIFSAISAVGTIKDGDAGLAFGALLGAGIYVTTVVTGSIALARPFKAMERPLLKDIVFYIAAVFWTFTIIFKQKIYIWEAVGFIGLYVVYVVVTLIARAIRQRQKRHRDPATAPLFDVTNFPPNYGNINPSIQDEGNQPRILVTRPDDDEEGSVESVSSAHSTLSHGVGIMTPNYLARWLVAHDNPDNSHRHSLRDSSESSRQRSYSYNHAPEDAQQPSASQDTSPLSHSLNESRLRSRSDMGPRRERPRVDFLHGLDNPAFVPREVVQDPLGGRGVSTRKEGAGSVTFQDSQTDEMEEEPLPPLKEFLYGILPIDYQNWNELSCISKCYEVIKAPVLFLLLIVTPIVDCDLPKHGWNKYRILVNTFLAPNFCFLVTKISFMTIGGHLPVGIIVLLGSLLLSAVVFFTSRPEKQPAYHPAFAFLGFITSIIWIYCIANEIVNILQSWGIIFNISNAILGLTFLAWGNSVGDTISNVVMAREGYPRMAISACFGGPLFNLLLGVGIPFTLLTAKNDGFTSFVHTSIEFVLIGGLLLSLLSSLIILPLRRFRIGRVYGLYLLCLYVAFLIVAILVETNIIRITV